MNSFIPLLCLLATLISCQYKKEDATNSRSIESQNKSTVTKTDIYKTIALESCTCMDPIVEKVYEANAFSQTDSPEQREARLEDIEQLRPQIEVCSEAIRQKYKSKMTSIEDRQKILDATAISCPETVAILNKVIATKK